MEWGIYPIEITAVQNCKMTARGCKSRMQCGGIDNLEGSLADHSTVAGSTGWVIGQPLLSRDGGDCLPATVVAR